MVRTAVRLPMGRDEIKTGESIGLGDQIVAATAVPDDAFGGTGIAGIHDDPAWCFDAIAQSLLPISVLHQKGFDGDICVFVNIAGFYLMNVHLVAGCVGALKAGGTD